VALSAAANHKRLRIAKPENTASDQDSRAIRRRRGDECVGRRTDLRLIAINEVRDNEEADGLDAGSAPQTFQNAGPAYTLAAELWLCWMRFMCISSRIVTQYDPLVDRDDN